MYLIVFLSGACVMALELLGPRLIGVYFGMTIYTWSAMIGVTLLGLAAGYAMGGAFAGRKQCNAVNAVAWILTAGAGLSWLILLIRNPVLTALSSMDLRSASLISSAILFGPLMAALGMVCPLAVRAIDPQGEAGRRAGKIFAVSTVGSFAGTLLSGFYLIPYLGIQAMIRLIAVIFGLSAVVLFIMELKKGKRLSSVSGLGISLLITLTMLLALWNPPGLPYIREGRLLHLSDSMYGQIKVLDMPPVRTLLVNNGVQSHWNFKKDRTNSPYVNFLNYLMLARPAARTMLDIGLGGGSIPKVFARRHNVAVDVVEIDPEIPLLAKKYFDLKPSDVRELMIDDGRRYVEACRKKPGCRYDFVVMDAFIGGNFPWQLLTVEAFASMRGCLNADGIVALSLPGARSGEASLVSNAVIHTLKKVFRHVTVFAQAPQSNESLFLILASDGPLEAEAEPETVTGDDELALLYLHRLISEGNITKALQDSISRATLLTDNKTPVGIWEWYSIARWQKDMRESFWDKNIYLSF